MLNELEQKIRKAIPDLYDLNYRNQKVGKQIQLNHVLEYAIQTLGTSVIDDLLDEIILRWNLKSNLLSDQSIELISFVNELKND